MSEIADIPEDISREAYLIVRDLSGLTIYAGREAWEVIVARALMAERERCARIADDRQVKGNDAIYRYGGGPYWQGSISTAEAIAAAIRRPTGESET